MKRGIFILLNIIASLGMWYLLPETLLSSVMIEKCGVIITGGTMRKASLLIFLVCAITSTLVVPKRRRTILTLVGNVILPVLLLFVLRIAQYAPVQTAILFVLIALLFFFDWQDFRSGKRKRNIIGLLMRWRATMLSTLLKWIVPLGIVFAWNGGFLQEESMQVLFCAQEEKTQEELFAIEGEEQWQGMKLEERLTYVQAMADYQCEKLGLTNIDVYVVNYSDEKVAGSYLHDFDAVFLNDQYLTACVWKDMVKVVAHEIYHRYEHAIIDSVHILEKEGFTYETLAYYEEALVLVEANANYSEDAVFYDTYITNEMEVQANAYAEEEVWVLSAIYNW